MSKSIRVSYEETSVIPRTTTLNLPYYSRSQAGSIIPYHYKISSAQEIIRVSASSTTATVFCGGGKDLLAEAIKGEPITKVAFELELFNALDIIKDANENNSGYSKDEREAMLHEQHKEVVNDFHRIGNEDRI